jgi:hypothetical protein
MLEEAYGKAVMKKTHVYELHKRFRDWHQTDGFYCTKTHLHIGRWLFPLLNVL